MKNRLRKATISDGFTQAVTSGPSHNCLSGYRPSGEGLAEADWESETAAEALNY